jgi:hypothetical protein
MSKSTSERLGRAGMGSAALIFAINTIAFR